VSSHVLIDVRNHIEVKQFSSSLQSELTNLQMLRNENAKEKWLGKLKEKRIFCMTRALSSSISNLRF